MAGNYATRAHRTTTGTFFPYLVEDATTQTLYALLLRYVLKEFLVLQTVFFFILFSHVGELLVVDNQGCNYTWHPSTQSEQ
jgi:hypothetical protein